MNASTNVVLHGRSLEPAGCSVRVNTDGAITFERAGRPLRAGDGLAAEIVDTVRGMSHGSPHPMERERTVAGDQTNVSVIVDEAYVVKLVAQWGMADRAASILTVLAQVGCTTVPELIGRVDWDHPDLGTSTLALAVEYLSDTEDGWTWAVEDSLSRGINRAPDRWAASLGEAVANLHIALASVDVAAPSAQQRAWSPRDSALHALDQALEVATEAVKARLVNRAPALRELLLQLPDSIDRGGDDRFLMQLHGDLHLGQALRRTQPGDSHHSYYLIDFDGDPQLPVEIRDLPENPARDVAHMLVSIDTLASVLQRRGGGVDSETFEWTSSLQSLFLESYRDVLSNAGVEHIFDESLLPAFMAEQFVRELCYSAQYLPRWEYAADGAITFRYPNAHVVKEKPWIPPAFTQIYR